MTAVAKHAITFYNLLNEDAKREKVGDHHLNVWRGSLTRLWNEVGASNAYYTKVQRKLADLGCIVILQRGSVNVESVVAVLREPAPEEFSSDRLTTATDPATLRQELENVKRNIGGIDIPEMFRSLDARLTALEREVRQDGKE